MMHLKILAFGIARDIFGGSQTVVEIPENATVSGLKTQLEAKYPRLQKLASYMIAVNDEYAQPGQTLSATDEIAIIPPVSGG
ncbi:MoaD/ThiS family protein [Adhaeribacter soli]|nr:MoaD/ThiS family protein [Adhaeribacter soli]